jgi:RHS repeat-associated protein
MALIVIEAYCNRASLWGTQSQAQGTPVADPYNQTRSSSFTYYTAADGVKNGLLKSETIEPGIAQMGVVTTYDYDSYGNKIKGTTANVSGASAVAVFAARASSSGFAAQTVTIPGSAPITTPAGTFATNASNALLQSESHTFDPRFGVALSLTGPNALTTTWQVDNFGRKVKEARADGTSTVSAYCLISAKVSDTSSNSATINGDPRNCPSPSAAEIPSEAVSFVYTEPRDVNGAKNGPFVRVYSDKAGRKLRTVTESFDGTNPPVGTIRLVVQDTDYNIYGVQTVVTQPYFLDSGSSTSSGTTHYGMSMSVYDVLGRVVASYTTDVTRQDASGVTVNTGGSQSSVAFGTRGSFQASKTSIVYGVLATTTTNDKNQTRREDKNLEGKVILVTDNLGAQVAHQHDAFGNLVATKDALQNTITIAYDQRGRKVSMNDPDTGLWTYNYNALGELVWQQSANQRVLAQVTTMAYDLLGRMTSRTEPEGVSTWYYDRNADASYCMDGSVSTRGAGKLCGSSTSTGINRKVVYDSLGRPYNSRTTVTNGPSFASALAYDATNGRTISQTYPSGLKVNYNYTTNGFLSSLTTGTTTTGVPLALNSTLWSAQTYNAWGKAEQQTYGNGVINRANFDAMTGRLTNASASLGTATDVLGQRYVWDSLSHLMQRDDQNGAGSAQAVSDVYTYDGIGRLQGYAVSSAAIPNLSRTVSLQYNAAGMILYKSDVGIYSYGAQGAGRAHPHALQSVAGAYTASYIYDNNGNVTTASGGKYSSVAYTSFNLPDSQNGVQGAAGGPLYKWTYDESHQRIKETRLVGTTTRTTWYLHPDNQGGLSFECDSSVDANCASASTSNRHYLNAGGMTIGVLVSDGALPTLGATQTAPPVLSTLVLVKVEYWHKDHLGSLISTTNQLGVVTQRYAYDPFGKRRQANGNYDPFGTLVIDWVTDTPSGTDRGYTGHEHLDDIGLINMNGRIFDPMLGMFLQSDPFIQDPTNLQNFNRYGYCYNNPLTCTDPSGQFFGIDDLLFAAIVATVFADATGIIDHRTARSLYSIEAAFLLGPEGGVFTGNYGMTQAAIAGFTTGAISTGTFKGGIQGAFSGMLFYGVGLEFGKGFMGEAGNITDYGKFSIAIAAHGVAGCVSSVVGGGKCGPGALSAAFSKAAVPFTSQQDPLSGTIVSAVIGGTASVLGGGKFANGAQTAAFGYLFNELLNQGGGTARERLARSGYTGAASEGSFDVTWKDNYPNTIPVDGGAADALQCTANCVGRNVFATGGQEQWKDGIEGGTLLHSVNSAHYGDTAVDFRALDVSSSKVLSCSANCGFRAGWWENWGNPHWHFQLNMSPSAKPPTITTDPLVPR